MPRIWIALLVIASLGLAASAADIVYDVIRGSDHWTMALAMGSANCALVGIALQQRRREALASRA